MVTKAQLPISDFMATTILVRVVCFTCEQIVEVAMFDIDSLLPCPKCDGALGETRRVEGFRILPKNFARIVRDDVEPTAAALSGR